MVTYFILSSCSFEQTDANQTKPAQIDLYTNAAKEKNASNHSLSMVKSGGSTKDAALTTKKVKSNAPVLLFTDLNSGPDVGLGDGKGSGTIVTLWGKYLGSEQGASTVLFIDSQGVSRACEVYYWKNADGRLPGGPANLYDSHNMQEIACSIPDSAMGAGSLVVSVENKQSNNLPFVVREGDILFVAPGGDNIFKCSWEVPCEYIDGSFKHKQLNKALGNKRLKAGDIVYSRGVKEPSSASGGVEVGLYLREIKGTETHPISLVAYPGTRASVSSANRGINSHKSSYINVSKYAIEVGYAFKEAPIKAGSPAKSNFHINAQQGRYVGNLMTQKEGKCFTGWSGAIVSNGLGGDGIKVYGNQILGLGCPNSSRYQHTIYLSNRVPGAYIKAWDVSYNYLKDNDVFLGLHMYDQTIYDDKVNLNCSWDVYGTILVTNNVIINQRGAGINISTADNNGEKYPCWTADIVIDNNTLTNVGLGKPQEDNVANADAIRVTGDLGASKVTITNNTVYGYGHNDSWQLDNANALEISLNVADPIVIIENNSFVQTARHKRLKWLYTTEKITSSNNNIFWNTATKSGNTPPKTLKNNIVRPPAQSLE